MNPINNQQFSDDYQKFVLQETNIKHVNQYVSPFDINMPKKAEKRKKDMKKQKEQKEKKNQKKNL